MHLFPAVIYEEDEDGVKGMRDGARYWNPVSVYKKLRGGSDRYAYYILLLYVAKLVVVLVAASLLEVCL